MYGVALRCLSIGPEQHSASRSSRSDQTGHYRVQRGSDGMGFTPTALSAASVPLIIPDIFLNKQFIIFFPHCVWGALLPPRCFFTGTSVASAATPWTAALCASWTAGLEDSWAEQFTFYLFLLTSHRETLAKSCWTSLLPRVRQRPNSIGYTVEVRRLHSKAG